MKQFVGIFLAAALAIGVSNWVGGQFSDWSKRVEEQKARLRAAQAAVDEPHDFPAEFAAALDSADNQALTLKDVLSEKPFGRPLTPYEGDLMSEADATLKVTADERARIQKEERQAEAQERADAARDRAEAAQVGSVQEATPAPGAWMWQSQGNPLDRGAYRDSGGYVH